MRQERKTRRSSRQNFSQSPPPASIDAEQQILGSILMDPDAINVSASLIPGPEAFFAPPHQYIYQAMLSLYEEGKPVDITMTTEKLQADGLLNIAGGRIYLIDLIDGIVTTAHIKHYIGILLQKYQLRRLVERGNEIIAQAYEYGTEPADVAPLIQEAVDIVSSSGKTATIVRAADIIPDLLSELDEVNQGNKELGFKTHIDDLNKIMRFRPGQLIIISARPSEGKSALLLNFCEYISQRLKQKTVLFSLEMEAKEIFLRQLLSRARVSSQRFISDINIQDNRWSEVVLAGDYLSKEGSNFLVCDQPGLTPLQIRAIAKEEDRKGKIGLIAIDYLTLVTPDNIKRSANREQDVANMTRSFKLLAREFRVPVLLCAQLNRNVDKGEKRRKPRLSDLRESGAIEQDADVVIFIHHDGDKINRKCCLIVDKNRGGRTAEVPVVWVPEYVRFEGALEE
ncbi:MAG: replicative DNA helicase [Candidatus Zixiibacteriota bacterium]